MNTTTLFTTYIQRSLGRSALLCVSLALACFAFSPATRAACDSPDPGCPGGNLAEGYLAFTSLAGGAYNTGIGAYSLLSDTTGSLNTGVGAGALLANTADQNTATGAGALLSNVTGNANTANGVFALFNNITGIGNTAFGRVALFSNTVGSDNTANGIGALALNAAGDNNTGVGSTALQFSTGSNNTALGAFAGNNVTTASNVICIGYNVVGNDVNDSCYIGNIFGATASSGVGVLVNSNGRLGTMTSSRRFKDAIKPIDKASETLYALNPVTFHYKKEIDPAGTPQFGLVAEDVEKVNPDLVVRDKEGKAYSVRYDQVNAMLLNEFLKEHEKVDEQQASISELNTRLARQDAIIAQQQKSFQSQLAKQEKQMEALRSGLEKVSAQLELSKSRPQTVLNNQ